MPIQWNKNSGEKITAADINELKNNLVTIDREKATKVVPIAAESNSRTLSLEDSGKIIRLTNPGNITITIPADSNPFDSEVDFPIGAEVAFVREGAGTVTITPASGVTLISDGFVDVSTPGKRKIKPFNSGAIIKVAANSWSLAGSLEA
jgi:hypothetical protein